MLKMEEENYKLDINTNNMCRCCLESNGNLKSIFCREIVDGHIHIFPNVFESVTSIKIQKWADKLPTKVCQVCKRKITEIFAFQQKCKNSDKLLQQILNLNNNSTTNLLNNLPIENISPVVNSDLDPNLMTNDVLCYNEIYLDVAEDQDESNTNNDEELDCETNLDDEQEMSLPKNDSNKCLIIESLEEIDTTTIHQKEFIKNEEYSYDANSITSTNVCNEESVKFDDVDNYEIQMLDEYVPESIHHLYKNCDLCSISILSNDWNKHRLHHGKSMIQHLNTIEYLRCSNCCTIFLDFNLFIHHANANNCTKMMEHYSDYQFLDEEETFYKVAINFVIPQYMYSCKKMMKTIECDFCNLKMNANLFEKHVLETHKCLKQFDSIDMTISQLKLDDIHRCGICDKLLPNFVETIYHVYFHSTTFKCPQKNCLKQYAEFIELNRHLCESKHSAVMEYEKEIDTFILSCNICDEMFNSQRSLTIHSRNHVAYYQTFDETNQTQPHYCNICGKSFAQTCDLIVHIRTHLNVRPYQCGQCLKSFCTAGQRNDHMSMHEKDKCFVCQVCGQKLISKRTLRGHMKIHEESRFVCKFCQKKFNRPYHLKQHIKIHGIQ